MTDALAAWLRDLGLERYEQAFCDNAIDAEVLPTLTDADLEKLGVLLGHRRRLLKAIAELGKGIVTATSLPEVPVEPSVPVAERRQLTTPSAARKRDSGKGTMGVSSSISISTEKNYCARTYPPPAARNVTAMKGRW